jgi:gluconate 2-dehydrogenase gamma chain
MSPRQGRRAFLKGLGTVGATGVAAMVPLEAAVPTQAAAKPPAAAKSPEAAQSAAHAYTFLSPPEAAFVEAAVDRLIPADNLTPSGTDCGVAVFIDRQLGGAWGSGDRMYMQGPWRKGTPTQGYQLPMTPAEFFRAGIASVNAYCRQTYRKEFDRLVPEQQVQVLQGLEQGRIAIDHAPAQDFFDLLLGAAMEGFFADPIYGGNREKVSWKMIGFPGVIAIYSEHIKTYRNRRYDVAPTSIADLT